MVEPSTSPAFSQFGSALMQQAASPWRLRRGWFFCGFLLLGLGWLILLGSTMLRDQHSRATGLGQMGGLVQDLGNAVDAQQASAFVSATRHLLPSLEAGEGIDTARLSHHLQLLEGSLASGSYHPTHYQMAVAELQALQNQMVARTRQAIARAERTRWLAGWGLGLLTLLLGAYAVWLWHYRRQHPLISLIARDRLGQMLFSVNPGAVIIADADERILAVNPAFTLLTGYTEAEVLGRKQVFYSAAEQDDQFFALVRAELARHGRWTGEVWQRRRSGEAYTENQTRIRINDGFGRCIGYMTVAMDLTPGQDAARIMSWQAQHDPLTGLPNRSVLHERLTRWLQRNHRQKEIGAVISINLDRFRLLNDSIGPSCGDLILVEVAQRLVVAVGDADTVVRTGSDEFGVLLPHLKDLAEAEFAVRTLMSAIKRPFEVEGRELFVTPSVGIALLPQDGADADTLVKNADSAMRLAKRQGGDQLMFYRAEFNAESSRRLELETHLRRALPNNQFELHYQPIIDQRTGQVASAEALLRWRHPKWGLVSPAEFIPVAEDTLLILDIGKWVIREVISQLSIWRAMGLDNLRVSLNLSVRQLQRAQDVVELQTMLRDAPAGQLTLEVTESILLDNSEVIMQFLNEVRGYGIKIALDDFGTGFSSLSYLRQYHFDILKIDRSFVRDMHRNKADLDLVAAIVSLGRILDIGVVAEGVETQAQLDALQESGCHLMQGYYFSKPLPAEDFQHYCMTKRLPGSSARVASLRPTQEGGTRH